MLEKKVKVTNSIEARPAALLVQTANRFSSSIKVKIDNKIINAKSIMGVMTLGILDGQDVTLIVDGADEQDASEQIAQFLTR